MFTELLAVGVTAVGFLTIGWRMFATISANIDKKLNQHEQKFEKNLETVWRRFDERKEFTDARCEKHQKLMHDTFLTKEVYKANHSHLQTVLEAQFTMFVKVTDEKISSIKGMMEDITKTIDQLKAKSN
jgi:hypothetical protein